MELLGDLESSESGRPVLLNGEVEVVRVLSDFFFIVKYDASFFHSEI